MTILKTFALFLTLLAVDSSSLQAQYYIVGTDPSAIKWRKMLTHNQTLIYPDYYTVKAHRFESILANLEIPVTASMQARIKPFPIIVHPEASFSNGFTILAPRRIELYPKHPVAGEIGDFPSQLLIHEYRHMAQMDRLNTGFTRAASIILGEQAQSLVLGLHIPMWFLEGDAVLTETLLSDAGRGRIASFSLPLRSKLISGEIPTWDRMSLGTYKDNLPNEYLFGYYMAARGRMLSYPLVWSDNLRMIGNNPFRIPGFSRLLQKKTGLTSRKLYKETMYWLQDYWTRTASDNQRALSLKEFQQDTTDYYSYIKPFAGPDRSIICLKKSLGALPVFVRIDSAGHEEALVKPGAIEDAGFSVHQGKIIWAEHNPTIRWGNRTVSDLFIWQENGKQTKRLTRNQRLFSPVFSQDGNYVACITEQTDGESFIVILKASDFSEIQRIPEHEASYFTSIGWGIDNSEILAITTGPNGRRLVRIDRKTGIEELIIDGGFAEISHPVYDNGQIYFIGPMGSASGVYRINSGNGSVEKAVSHRYGINYLTTSDNRLYLSVHSPNGYRPAAMDIDSIQAVASPPVFRLQEPVTRVITREKGEESVIFSEYAAAKTVSQPYRKASHLFRFHSWAPAYIDPDSYSINPGAVVMSQNDLSTLIAQAGYQYNKPHQSHSAVASVTYTGFLPVIDAEFRREYRYPESDSSGIERPLELFSNKSKVQMYVPLNFSSGIWSRRIVPALTFLHNNAPGWDIASLPSAAAGGSVQLAVLRKVSYRDLYSGLGFSIGVNVSRTLNPAFQGWNTSARVLGYLPGGLRNSSLRILNSYTNLSYPTLVDNPYPDFPRGQLAKNQTRYYSFKADFSVPLAYPDWSLSWLLYIKRIRTNLFFDGGYFFDKKEWLLTSGIDLLADFNLLRAGLDLESGIRVFYFPQTSSFGAEFLYGFKIK
jgi:hypothetical protein